jgi:Divergent InlB B-repeat domain
MAPTTSVHAQTTALFFDSQPGDYIGQGAQRTYTAADATFTITANWRSGVSISIIEANYDFWWYLDFSTAGNTPLAVGSYGAAQRYPFATGNGLDFAGSGRGCNELTGRYVVREITRAPDGTVLTFAADFEQHCEDGNPALFGAIRYNSTISDLVPFGGAYPLYQLVVSLPDHGRVTGGGVDCGAGNSACQVSLATAAWLQVTAVPDSGYVFIGWTGDCRGATTTSVHVNGPKSCAALFEPLVSSSARTLLYWDSQQGDYIGGGSKAIYSPSNSEWTVTSAQNGNRLHVDIEDGTTDWHLDFSAPGGQPLAVGYYGAARRYPFTPFNGLDASGSGRGCNSETGRFVVLEIAVGPDGTVQRFAADFEQHCEDLVPALFGAIRYNSTIDETLPFGGEYPSYQLSLTPPVNGHVSGTGIDCGGTSSQCLLTLTAAAQVTLTATADPDYRFMGWTEDCSGGTTTTLHVNGPKRCAARFEPTAATAPRTVMRWDSQPGNYLGGGRSEVFSPANSQWKAGAFQNGNAVQLTIDSVGPKFSSTWALWFQAPDGESLQPGRRYAAASFSGPGVPGFYVTGNGSFCGGGEFTVREVSFGPQSTVLRFAADFVLNCGNPSGPLLTGSVQYNSRLEVPLTTLSVDAQSLHFASLHNGVSVTSEPTPQTVQLALSRPTVGWTAVANQPWIQISPSSGTGSAVLTVRLSLLGSNPGAVSGTGSVAITLTDGSETSATINLTVALYLTGTTKPPIGFVDTPLENSIGVTGAIPITGWAVDDLEVTGVTICRAAVGAEVAPVDANCGGAAQIFVGSGIFIEGARPDVQAAYPAYPRNDSAGWGFMLLTNTLPNQGNGTFAFYVYARDREGHAALLGTRTMTCDNAHAGSPFGTIDTPGQGETVTGSAYVNFGWALTQNPKYIPIDGSTLMVYVDGVPIGNPSYNFYRSDVANAFPGLANSNGAVGFRVIDTTTLSNGLHTIVWTATDSAGMTSGLGSRFFRVSNGAAVGLTNRISAASTAATPDESLAGVPIDTSPVAGRRSWNAEAPWQSYGAGRSGRAVVRGEELDRFELALGAQTGETHSGYLRVGQHLRPMPIGSHLEPQTGIFTWSPGVGFVGTYDLVFVRSAGARTIARREVRFILQAKGSGHVGAQVVIDAPQSLQELLQPFALGGWAADLDAASGTGIDTLHVWAYPLTGGPPVFVGAATYGGARPDVAAIHGDQFHDSGYGLVLQGLPPGGYDLAVFAWSNVSGGFLPAQVVRFTVR